MKALYLSLITTLITVNVRAQQPFTPSADFSKLVMFSFIQGYNRALPDDNCASIAVIKCIVGTYGIDGVFKNVADNGNSYAVTFRNGQGMVLTKDELKQATTSCSFDTLNHPEIFHEAIFIYAVMAKQAISYRNIAGFSYCQNYTSSLYFFHGNTGGLTSSDLPQLIGLRPLTITDKSNLNFVYANNYHAAYASNGYFDADGTSRPCSLRNFRGHINYLHPHLSFDEIMYSVSD